MQTNIYVYKSGKVRIEEEACLFDFYNMDKKHLSALITAPYGKISLTNIQILEYLGLLRKGELIDQHPSLHNLHQVFNANENRNYIKGNFFPIRYIWEDAGKVENILAMSKKFSNSLSVRQCFVMAHYVLPNGKRNVRTGHTYLPLGDVPLDFTKTLDKVMKKKSRNGTGIQGMYKKKIALSFTEKIDVQKIGEQIE